MMSDIINKIVNMPQRETGGTTAFNRFSYQNNWALCHLLELHENGKNYIIAFECHDDVLEIDLSTEHCLKFFQIKTKRDGALKITNAKEISYLGKLYCNYQNFPDNTSGLFLVSNNSFIADLKDGKSSIGRDAISLLELKDKDIKKIESSLKKNNNVNDINLKIISLLVSPLALDTHQDTTLGKITRLLENLGKAKAAVPFHKALSDEINRRASFESYSGNIDEFKHKKSISREQFQKLLDDIVLRPDFDATKKSILDRLDSEGTDFIECKNMRDGLNYLEIDLFSAQSDCIQNAKTIIQKECRKQLTQNSTGKFKDLLNLVYAVVNKAPSVEEIKQCKNINYIMAMIAVELYEK